MSFVKVIMCRSFVSFYSAHVSVDLTVAVRVCWTEADSVRYTSQIANCVSLRSSPVPSPALCVASNGYLM